MPYLMKSCSQALKSETARSEQIYTSLAVRLACIPGAAAMAAAFCTYLGPYHHSFRRMMLTVHWPHCLRERGIPLVIDSVSVPDTLRYDWSIQLSHL